MAHHGKVEEERQETAIIRLWDLVAWVSILGFGSVRIPFEALVACWCTSLLEDQSLMKKFGEEKKPQQTNNNCHDRPIAEGCSTSNRWNGKVKAGFLQPVVYSQAETTAPHSCTGKFEKNKVISTLVTFFLLYRRKKIVQFNSQLGLKQMAQVWTDILLKKKITVTVCFFFQESGYEFQGKG